jgi:uncharacterized membrane protein YedE/YeeE
MEGSSLIALAGLAIGIVFGIVVQRTNFCAMGAISDAVALGDRRRLRSWLLAIAIAMIGTQALLLSGIVAIDKSFYLAPRIAWIAMLLGGLLFGFGMVMAGGCASRSVVRAGSGSLKSIVVLLVMGVVGYATARGLLYYPRTAVEAAATELKPLGLESQAIPEFLAQAAGAGVGAVTAIVAAAVALALLGWCFVDGRFRRSTGDVAAGMVLGALIVAGWAATGWAGADEFDPQPPVSLSLVFPVGETLQYLMTFTGAKLSFGVAVVAGILLGSLGAALASNTFRVEMFADRRDMLRHLAAGALMGFGGVMAAGCTVGQGLTGVATLALGSLIAFAGIVAGAVIAVKLMMWRMDRAALDHGM